jgi:hypothetical protein
MRGITGGTRTGSDGSEYRGRRSRGRAVGSAGAGCAAERGARAARQRPAAASGGRVAANPPCATRGMRRSGMLNSVGRKRNGGASRSDAAAGPGRHDDTQCAPCWHNELFVLVVSEFVGHVAIKQRDGTRSELAWLHRAGRVTRIGSSGSTGDS